MHNAVAETSYVGLSMAIFLSQHNEVKAVDIIQDNVDLINNKKSPIVDTHTYSLHGFCSSGQRFASGFLPAVGWFWDFHLLDYAHAEKRYPRNRLSGIFVKKEGCWAVTPRNQSVLKGYNRFILVEKPEIRKYSCGFINVV